MSDDLMAEFQAAAVRQFGLDKPWPVVAIFDAVPGWHAVTREATELSNPSDEDRELGMKYVIIRAFPISKWGMTCPPEYYKGPAFSAPEEGGISGALLGALARMGGTRTPHVFLPLDPREDEPSFFRVDQLWGVYPPSEGTAKEVIEKAKAALQEESDKLLAQKQKERR
jgi:hypothetical protein